MTRRLAAILAADVVGYSRLMGEDEAGTLERLKALRRGLVQPKIAEHGGRIVKLMGDGLLAEFPSVVEAVHSALEIQNEIIRREPDRPDAERLRLRIGINLGDIIVEGGDVYGDGVNLAARLESTAEPHGICLSSDAYRQVKGKLDVRFEDLGERRLKNISEPVRIYRLIIGAGQESKIESPFEADRPSVAVLPFVNLSQEPEQDYFAQGITQDIITELSRFRSLQVVAQLSVFELGDRSRDPKSVGQVLGVGHLVMGNLRKAGNRVRVSVQLIDCETGAHEWAERYDRELTDIFALQDEVVHSIVTTLGGRITAAETERALRKRPERLEAYDCVLRCIYYSNLYDRESGETGYRLAEQAVAAAPTYGRAHAQLAWFNATRSWYDRDNASHLDLALKFGLQAVKLDPTDGFCWHVLANVHLYRQEFDEAERCARQARACNPNDLRVIAGCAEVLAYVGEREEALKVLQQFEASEPLTPNWTLEILGVIHFAFGRYAQAAEAFGRMSHLNYWNQAHLAACYGQLSDVQRARKHLKAYAAEWPDASIRGYMQREGGLFKDPADREPWLEGLRKAGLPE